MNLPNYFLVDLPPGAELTPTMIGEACQTLRRNRELYLANCPTLHLIKVIESLAEAWLDPDFPFRRMALEEGPVRTGFSSPVLARGLDGFFGGITRSALQALLNQDLGTTHRLDELCADTAHAAHWMALARGPELLVQIASGNIPNPTLTGMVLGLLMRSAQFVKCATGRSFLPRLFAHSLYEAEPKLAASLELAEWPGGTAAIEEALFAEADCVIATGHDETLAHIRQRLPAKVRFLAHGHRVSFGYVTHDVLTSHGAKKVVARAAADVVAWDQLGCLSPHAFYVEPGGAVSAEQFAGMLAAELERREAIEPRGELTPHESATIALKRDFYFVRAAASSETRIWQSDGSTAWTVVFEADPRFQASCLHRFIYVKAADNLDVALRNAESVRGQVSTVGLAAHDDRARLLATQLARWGVTRVCPVGQMQRPPLTWRHDGRPALGDLVTWTDWQQ